MSLPTRSSRTSRAARSISLVAAVVGSVGLVASTTAFAGPDHHGGGHGRPDHRQAPDVTQVNLVSDVPGQAPLVDPDLVNPWGLALGPTTPLWSANAGSDTATLYSSAPGATTATKVPTVRVTLPGSPAIATGQVANNGTAFVLSNTTTSGPAKFIFATITGRIEAWSPQIDPLLGNAEIKATVPGAAYTGLAEATAKTGDQLYAADFAQGRVDVFDSTFKQVRTTNRQFVDNRLPKGFAPFNVQELNGDLFVSYAEPDPTTGREVVGKGLGYVDEYTTGGQLVNRIASRQSLNAPWGLAIAPASWGRLAGDLLVGNFGDGRVNVLAAKGHGRFSGTITEQLRNQKTGRTLSIPGLWSLTPGTATTGGADALWFSAGIDNETHGLIGELRHS